MDKITLLETIQKNKTALKGTSTRLTDPVFNLELIDNFNVIKAEGSIDFSRSTTLSFTDKYNVSQTAPINVPAFEKIGMFFSTNDILTVPTAGNLPRAGTSYTIVVYASRKSNTGSNQRLFFESSSQHITWNGTNITFSSNGTTRSIANSTLNTVFKFVLVFNASNNTERFYINDVLVSNVSSTGQVSLASTFSIGSNGSNTNGNIRELKIFDYALTQQEVEMI